MSKMINDPLFDHRRKRMSSRCRREHKLGTTAQGKVELLILPTNQQQAPEKLAIAILLTFRNNIEKQANLAI